VLRQTQCDTPVKLCPAMKGCVLRQIQCDTPVKLCPAMKGRVLRQIQCDTPVKLCPAMKGHVLRQIYCDASAALYPNCTDFVTQNCIIIIRISLWLYDHFSFLCPHNIETQRYWDTFIRRLDIRKPELFFFGNTLDIPRHCFTLTLRSGFMSGSTVISVFWPDGHQRESRVFLSFRLPCPLHFHDCALILTQSTPWNTVLLEKMTVA
jgi:hypothetical protein